MNVEGLSVDAEAWALSTFVDPNLAASQAPAFWLPSISGFVLATSASAPRANSSFRPFYIEQLDCDVSVLDIRPGCQHVLFRDHSQRLQISVSGVSVREPVTLSALGMPATVGLTRRSELRRALDYLIAHGRLPRQVHRPVAGLHRLLMVLLALDAETLGHPPRETAALLFGEQRVARDWDRNGRALRAQLARASERGRLLAEGSFRSLLR